MANSPHRGWAVRVFKAKFNGRCKSCQKPTKAGVTQMAYNADNICVCLECATNPPAPTQLVIPTWEWELSAQQLAVAVHFVETMENSIVAARAGTGKTSLLIRAFWMHAGIVSGEVSCAYCIFSKDGADDVQGKLPPTVDAGTTHSFALKAVTAELQRRTGRRVYPKVVEGNDKTFDILNALGYPRIYKRDWVAEHGNDDGFKQAQMERDDLRVAVASVVAMAKETLSEGPQELWRMAQDYDEVDLGDDPDKTIALADEVLAIASGDLATIDFADMLWLTVVNNLPLPKRYDKVVIDEAQDLNRCQQVYVQRLVNPGGSITAVGDDWQAIFAFRGADNKSLENLHRTLNARIFPLTITRRCGRAQVQHVNDLFLPDYEAAPKAPEGSVRTVDANYLRKHVKQGDAMLCRTNAPTIGWAFDLLAEGYKVKVKGRFGGENFKGQLTTVIKDIFDDDLGVMRANLQEYYNREVEKLRRKKASDMKISKLEDKLACVSIILDRCHVGADAQAELDSIFDETKPDIVLSTIHRAKGLEWDNVWLIEPQLVPFPKAKSERQMEQELHLWYVAITRSRHNFYYVRSDDAKMKPSEEMAEAMAKGGLSALP